MRKVLIAHSSEDLPESLKAILGNKYDVSVCSDGNTAQKLLSQLRPDILVLDLTIPGKDGITILEDALPFVPPVVLATTKLISHYVHYSAATHGIGYIMLDPCEARCVATRLLDMLQCAALPPQNLREPEIQTVSILMELGIPTQMDGYTQLRAGIPLFALDTAQKLNKELYPDIAKICGFGSGEQVERSIRTAIQSAWKNRNIQVWGQYFSPETNGDIPCPSNKVFISHLAEKIRLIR